VPPAIADRCLTRLGLLRRLADKTGVTSGFSRALAAGRVRGHDRGPVLADLARRSRARTKSPQ
jgi:hypothetical protein